MQLDVISVLIRELYSVHPRILSVVWEPDLQSSNAHLCHDQLVCWSTLRTINSKRHARDLMGSGSRHDDALPVAVPNLL